MSRLFVIEYWWPDLHCFRTTSDKMSWAARLSHIYSPQWYMFFWPAVIPDWFWLLWSQWSQHTNYPPLITSYTCYRPTYLSSALQQSVARDRCFMLSRVQGCFWSKCQHKHTITNIGIIYSAIENRILINVNVTQHVTVSMIYKIIDYSQLDLYYLWTIDCLLHCIICNLPNVII